MVAGVLKRDLVVYIGANNNFITVKIGSAKGRFRNDTCGQKIGRCPKVVAVGNGGVEAGMHPRFLPFGEHDIAVGVIHGVLNVVADITARCVAQHAVAPPDGVGSIANQIILIAVGLLSNRQIVEFRNIIAAPDVVQVEVMPAFVSENHTDRKSVV